MRSEWVSKLTLIQQAEMAIVSAHNSKQTELRCEVFLWIQIILSFFYLTFFCGLHCSIPYTSQQQDLFVTTHCTHTITLCTDIFSSSGCILLFMQEKRSLTISGFFFSPYWRQGLPHCHPVNYFTFLIAVTHLTQTLFFFSAEAFKSVFGTQSPQGRHQQLRDLSAPGHHEPGTGVELTPALLVSWLWLYCAV